MVNVPFGSKTVVGATDATAGRSGEALPLEACAETARERAAKQRAEAMR
jgi:hypothetical protein